MTELTKEQIEQISKENDERNAKQRKWFEEQRQKGGPTAIVQRRGWNSKLKTITEK